ncbi:MAG: N-formylglutamate deformylase [Rhizobiales bacterium]|nr:N-formylglutamate deformylase [Hyphomicrobiales bacterium]
MDTPLWLTVQRGDAPLLVSLPHTGTDLPEEIAPGLVSPWLARKDCDWWIEKLYGFARELGATVVRTSISRTAIDVNRDPSGQSLYPGQATTELCPTTTFDGEPLYRDGKAPNEAEIARRKQVYFDPYHAALARELARLREAHPHVVLYDCHSIRSIIPRLFEGRLPVFNIGTNSGAACDPELTQAIEAICDGTRRSRVTNARFKGGYITRSYGDPAGGVHAVQMELACRAYMREQEGPVDKKLWPSTWDPTYAAPMAATLRDILNACLDFAARAAGHIEPPAPPTEAPPAPFEGLAARIRGEVAKQGFMAHLGAQMTELAPGAATLSVERRPQLLQQNGLFHGGVIGFLVDNATTIAAATALRDPGKSVLTAEYKVNMLSPARGDRLICRAQVLRAGRNLIVVDADVVGVADGRENAVATALATIAVVDAAPRG